MSALGFRSLAYGRSDIHAISAHGMSMREQLDLYLQFAVSYCLQTCRRVDKHLSGIWRRVKILINMNEASRDQLSAVLYASRGQLHLVC